MATTERSTLISTVEAVIAALGGKDDAAAALGETEGRLAIYKHRGSFPAHKFLRHNTVLRERGLNADPALWSQEDGEKAEAEARSA